MPKRILITLLCGLSLAAYEQTPEGLPKGASEVQPGIYRSVDKDGKAWLHRRTPFGWTRTPEDAAKKSDDEKTGERSRMTPFGPSSTTPVPAGADRTATPFGESKAPKTTVQTKVTEDGDQLRFERPTPFGVSRWTRKKSELTEDEKKLWESQRNAPQPANAK